MFIFYLCDYNANATATALEYQHAKIGILTAGFLIQKPTSGQWNLLNIKGDRFTSKYSYALRTCCATWFRYWWKCINAVHHSQVWVLDDYLSGWESRSTILPQDPPVWLEFRQWLNRNQGLHNIILFTDEAQFTRDGIFR